MKKVIVLLLTLTFVVGAAFPAMAAEGDPIVAVNSKGEQFTSLVTAVDETYASDFEGVVTLIHSWTLSSELYIPDGIEVVIPASEDYDNSLSGNNKGLTEYAPGDPFVTLTVSSEGSIDLEGTLLVAGNQQCKSPYAGMLTGDYGNMILQEGASITVEGTGKLYARGKISGDGSITAKSGAEIYQLLQVEDWRGGNATTQIYEEVFPFNRYNVNNIQSEITYEYGSTLYAQYYIAATGLLGSTIERHGNATVISSSGNALYVIESSDSKIVIHGTEITLYGNVRNGSFSITIPGILFNHTISTEGMVCPVYGMNVTVAENSTLTVTESLKFLPDTSLVVNGTLNVNDNAVLYFYTYNGYKPEYNITRWHGTAGAFMTVAEGAEVSGVFGSSSSDFSNITGVTLTTVSTTATIPEAEQTPGQNTATVVDAPFFTGTPATAE